MLLVILVSAAPDGGAPGSRSIGSAFDPATSSVAVARQHSRVVATATAGDTRPALPALGTSGLGAAILPAFLALDHAAIRPLHFSNSHAAVDTRLGAGAHRTRAPPAA
jgi:hypothetical protein